MATGVRITDEELRSGYLETAGRPMSNEDFDAFFKLCSLLDVPPVGTYKEINEAVGRELERWSNDIERRYG